MTAQPQTLDEGRDIEPAPWCKDALFVITLYGDGSEAILVRGWEALCRKLPEVHYFQPDAGQRNEVLDRLVDWDRWELNGSDDVPYYVHFDYEDGAVSVTRITDDQTAHADLLAALETSRPVVAAHAQEVLNSCAEWDGLTNSYDRSTMDEIDLSVLADLEEVLAKIDAALAKGRTS